MGGMIFEWDEAKDLANQRKHGVSFSRASRAFDDPLRVTLADRVEGGEMRWQTFGMIEDLLLVMVAHTIWDLTLDVETVRIISARRATKRERWNHENGNG
jgi:uncharacterized protein